MVIIKLKNHILPSNYTAVQPRTVGCVDSGYNGVSRRHENLLRCIVRDQYCQLKQLRTQKRLNINYDTVSVGPAVSRPQLLKERKTTPCWITRASRW